MYTFIHKAGTGERLTFDYRGAMQSRELQFNAIVKVQLQRRFYRRRQWRLVTLDISLDFTV